MGACACCRCGKEEDPKDYYGLVTTKRKCTDIMFCLLYFLFMCGFLVVGIIGLLNGRPATLVYGTDYQARICGSDADVVDYRLTVYPRINEDMIINAYRAAQNADPSTYTFYGVCTAACPSAGAVVCNDNVAQRDTTSEYSSDAKLRHCLKDVGGALYGYNADPLYAPGSTFCNNGGNAVVDNCWLITMDHSEVLFRCIPKYNVTTTSATTCLFPNSNISATDPACIVAQQDQQTVVQKPAQTNYLFDQLNGIYQVWGRYFTDLQRSWWVIALSAVVVAVLLCFIWLLALRYSTKCMVYLTIVLFIICLIVITFVAYVKAGIIDAPAVAVDLANSIAQGNDYVPTLDVSQDNQNYYAIGAYVFTALTIIGIVVAVGMRKQIRTAVRTIELASESLQAMPTLVLFPLTSVLALAALLVWWVFVAAALMSAGTITTEDLGTTFDTAAASLDIGSNASAWLNETSHNGTLSSFQTLDYAQWLLIYHFFGLLWTNQFISGIAIMSIAGAVAGWYFSLNAEECESKGLNAFKPSSWPVAAAVWRTVRYHLGSVAMGSFLIALVQFVRAVLAYMHRQMKQTGGDKNTMVKYIMCCVQYCMACLEWCLKVVTHNAYIFVALKGYSFCSAAGSTLTFIIGNLRVFALVNIISELIFILGKFFVASISAFVCWGMLDSLATFDPSTGDSPVTSTWLPTLVTFIFAVFISSAFFSVYDVAIDTVLICYVTDMAGTKTATGGALSNVALHAKGTVSSSIQGVSAATGEDEKSVDDGDVEMSAAVVAPRIGEGDAAAAAAGAE